MSRTLSTKGEHVAVGMHRLPRFIDPQLSRPSLLNPGIFLPEALGFTVTIVDPNIVSIKVELEVHRSASSPGSGPVYAFVIDGDSFDAYVNACGPSACPTPVHLALTSCIATAKKDCEFKADLPALAGPNNKYLVVISKPTIDYAPKEDPVTVSFEIDAVYSQGTLGTGATARAASTAQQFGPLDMNVLPFGHKLITPPGISLPAGAAAHTISRIDVVVPAP